MLAKLLSKINTYNPSSVGLDIVFPEKDRTSPLEILSFYKEFLHIDASIHGLDEKLQNNDLLFANAIKNTQSALSIYLSDTSKINNECPSIKGIDLSVQGLELQNSSYILCNTPLLSNASNNFGFINTSKDEDGILRRMPLFREYNEQTIPTLALAILQNIDSKIYSTTDNTMNFLNHTISMDKNSNVLLNYYEDNWYKKISALDILNDNVSQDDLTGKIIIIGSSAVALHDQVITPSGKSMAGVQIHVTLIDNILNGTLMVQPQKYKNINLVLSFILSTIMLFLLFTERNVSTIVLFTGTIIVSFFLTLLHCSDGIYISLGYFLIPFVLHFFIITILEIIFEIFERKLYIEELNKSHIALLDSMVHVAEVHDIETGAHIVRTKEYVKRLAQHLYKKGHFRDQLSPTKIEIIYRTAPLHDLGKVGIPDSILKKPGKLTTMEFEVMKTHPMLGVHIINNAINSYSANDFFITGRNIAHYHHEKWDGSGYPEAIKGLEIPIEARLMALADVYDALINKRVYKEAFSYEDTIQIIIDGRGTHFDPIMVDAFLECQDEFMYIAELYADQNV
ncbi:MAG: HD-GYP domain-containing protein (c-di-GMP phosphodiesterase class II) [Sulfurimonas sp.]|jgi:HD-GYP domain-containing protein (c-di-GMP phosphodiesterase class II)